jgi:hypothetical protein
MIDQKMRSLLLLADLRNTTDLIAIEEAVYSGDKTREQYIAENSLLTADQCRYLYPRLKDLSLSLSQERFPADLLYEIALKEEDIYFLDLILTHPNVNEETRVALTLLDRP